MTQEELTITALLHTVIPDVNQLREELDHIESLLCQRRLYRRWVQDPEGADLFSEDLAKVEAKLAEREGKREALMEELNRYERRRHRLERHWKSFGFDRTIEPKKVIDDYDIPF
jgi:hypothetical protein